MVPNVSGSIHQHIPFSAFETATGCLECTNSQMLVFSTKHGPNSAQLVAQTHGSDSLLLTVAMRQLLISATTLASNTQTQVKLHLRLHDREDSLTIAYGSSRPSSKSSVFADVITGGPCVLMLLCLMFALSGALPAAAQKPIDGDVKAQFGDWQVVCKEPPPGSKSPVCALVQSVTAEDRSNVGLTVYFQKFSNGTQVLRVFAPLGVLLPPGLGLKIDGKDVGHAPFLRCHTFACYAQVVVEDGLIKRLSSGKTAIFIIFQTEEAGIGIPISLAGFTKGLASLK